MALGWAARMIEVIDTDLGMSGKWGVDREGFTELVSRVCLGEVGAIFGIEITRLGRSNADVARLAEFARITGTLLIDRDGVYDLADVNDRVVLGFKGTMGEMELHVMAQRLQATKRAAAERGELRTPLPVGLVHDDAGDGRDRPRCRGPGRDPGHVRRVRRVRVGLRRSSPRSPAASSRCAPTAGPGPGSCAGARSPTPGCWGS